MPDKWKTKAAAIALLAAGLPARASARLARARAADSGALTLEWVVIAGILVAGALAAGILFRNAISSFASGLLGGSGS
jgi:hypothetical protein